MYTGKNRGFTLIELLVVIAIIAILAGFLAVGLPRAIEKAKIADAQNDFVQLRNALSVYMTDHGSYPPAYGYFTGYEAQTGDSLYYLKPYLARIGEFGNTDLYDRFSFTDDSNQNGTVERLEYTPPGVPQGGGKYLFDESPGQTPYFAISPLPPTDEQAPYIYLPVNSRQAQKVRSWFWQRYNSTSDPKYLYAIDDGAGAGNNPYESLNFPATQYDDFVLISVGPWGSTGGVVAHGPLASQLEYQYHVDVLHAYFLATRDANENGLLDFDYLARKQGEGTAEAYDADGLYHLPGAFKKWQNTGFTGSAPGPLIFTP
jgi:prepilin-type N-terminal cleavage/methylation domain-containing protein